MRDIANELGISPSTVSLALRNDPRITPARRSSIQETAKAMGYRSDPTLSALVSYRYPAHTKPQNHTLAVVVDHPNVACYETTQCHMELLAGAGAEAKRNGYKLEVFWINRDYNGKWSTLDRVLYNRGIRGILLQSLLCAHKPTGIEWSRHAAVKVNLHPTELRIDSVQSDQMMAVRIVMRHLRQQGFKRIGLVTHRDDESRNGALISSGYYHDFFNQLDAGSTIIPPLFLNSFEFEVNEPAVLEWAMDHHIDAFISNWNCFEQTAHRMAALFGRHCKYVPICADSSTRHLGGVDQCHERIGRIAIDLLVHKLKAFEMGENEVSTNHLVQPEWIPEGHAVTRAPHFGEKKAMIV